MGGPRVTGHGLRVTGRESRATGHGPRVTGAGSRGSWSGSTRPATPGHRSVPADADAAADADTNTDTETDSDVYTDAQRAAACDQRPPSRRAGRAGVFPAARPVRPCGPRPVCLPPLSLAESLRVSLISGSLLHPLLRSLAGALSKSRSRRGPHFLLAFSLSESRFFSFSYFPAAPHARDARKVAAGGGRWRGAR